MKISRISLLLLSLFPGGCLYSVPEEDQSVQTAVGEVFHYHRDILSTTTFYQGYIAGLSASERIAECNRLIREETWGVAGISIRLHTALIMMLTPECGGPEKALPIFESIRDQALQIELKSLVRYQVAMANRLVRRSEQTKRAGQHIDTLETDAELLKKELNKKNDELKQLKATLDALKEIETTFHQRNELGAP